MTRVITEICDKHLACVDVCPVDCIHPKTDEDGYNAAPQLYINPDECIDCGACEDVCPVNAIFPEDEVPEPSQQSIQTNRDYFSK